MRKAAIITAVILLIAGLTLAVAAIVSAGFDFRRFSTVKTVTNTYPVDGDFTGIRIEETTADLVFKASEDGTASVVCVEREKDPHTVAVENGTLVVRAADGAKRTNLFAVSFESTSVTVYLPKDAYETLSVDTSTGDVTIPAGLTFGSVDVTGSTGDVCCGASVTEGITVRISTGDVAFEHISAGAVDCKVTTGSIRMQSVACAGDVKLKISTGKTVLEGLTCRNLSSEGSTGRLEMKDVAASGTLTVERSTGDVTLDLSDAAEIRIKTTTGDVTGTLRTGKIFVTKSSTGDIRVPESAAGGRCEVTTSTGDITLRIADGK